MTEYCQKCNKRLDESKIVWVELSETDGKYYPNGIPEEHKSQGSFAFGKDCAKNPNEVSETEYLKKRYNK